MPVQKKISIPGKPDREELATLQEDSLVRVASVTAAIAAASPPLREFLNAAVVP